MEMISRRTAQVIYGSVFCIALPVLLWYWSVNLSVSLPVGAWDIAGYVLLSVGLALLATGMWNLIHLGGGLPMNAFPPVRYVTRGAYGLLHHPIYAGFCMGVAGLSMVAESPTGLYVITPIAVLLCAALVLGYEHHDLRARFGTPLHRTFFDPPVAGDAPATPAWRIRGFVLAFSPWLILYELVIFIGVLPGSINTFLPGESGLPVVEWMEVPYILTYVFVGFAPFVITTLIELRRFILNAWIATAIGIFMHVTFPLHAEPRMFEASSIFGQMIAMERSWDGPAAASPSFHVIWALLACTVWVRRFPGARGFFAVVTTVMVLACVAVGAHSVLDIFAGMAVFVLTVERWNLWRWLNQCCEHIANSWTSIRIGPLRIINHAVYAFAAAAVGIFIAGVFGVPPLTLVVVTCAACLGGVAWGQWIEGSPRLLRPFGYFGAIGGGVAGVLIASFVQGTSAFSLLAAFALAAPLAQAVGRIRCLVQGCCHGKPIAGIGIRYRNPHSRVCRSGAFPGEPLHNTQLYSILSNIVIFLILWRLWYGESSPSLIAGLYFLLTGVQRFVEEAYRGEVQTKSYGGLRLYQWFAVFFVVAGIMITCVDSADHIRLSSANLTTVALISGCGGLLWAFGMGMDFPSSKVPFSKLSD